MPSKQQFLGREKRMYFLCIFYAPFKKYMYFWKFSLGRNLVRNLPKFCYLRKSSLNLVEKET